MAVTFSDSSGIWETLCVADRDKSRITFTDIVCDTPPYRGYQILEYGTFNGVSSVYVNEKTYTSNQTATITTPPIELKGDVGTTSRIYVSFKVLSGGSWVWMQSIAVLPHIPIAIYFTPVITDFSIVRADNSGNPIANGTYLKYTLTCDLAVVGSNTADVKLKYRAKGATLWDELALLTDVTTINEVGVTLSSPTFIAENGHDIVIEITDNLANKAIATRELQSSATKLFYFDKTNRRIGIGAKNTVDNSMLVGMNTAFVEGVNFENCPTFSSSALADLIELLSGNVVYDSTLTGSIAAGSDVFSYTFPDGIDEGTEYEFEITMIHGGANNTSSDIWIFLNGDYTYANYKPAHHVDGTNYSGQTVIGHTYSNATYGPAVIKGSIRLFGGRIIIEGTNRRAESGYPLAQFLHTKETDTLTSVHIRFAVAAAIGSRMRIRKIKR